MCFAFDARPPELPADLALPTLAGGAAAEPLELTSADGTRFSAALAEAPASERRPGRRRSCPTSAACTASTSSWPSASRRPAITPS